MGSFFTRLFDRMATKKESRILMVGLDAAGKTTILYKLKLGEVVTTIPTIGACRPDGRGGGGRGGGWAGTCTCVRGRAQASTWRRWSTRASASQCGTWAGRTRSGRCGATTTRTRRASSSWWTPTTASASARPRRSWTACWRRRSCARRCCWCLQTSRTCPRPCPCPRCGCARGGGGGGGGVIWWGRPTAVRRPVVSQVSEELGLAAMRSRTWHIQGCCATTGDGLYEGLDWLSATITKLGK
jgi:hypothetical protein